MPHSDGPLFYPTISTISCGSHTVLEFYKSQSSGEEIDPTEANLYSVSYEKSDAQLCCKILVEPRSLLIIKDSMYNDHLHSISNLSEDLICDKVCNLHSCEITHKLGDRLERGRRISLTIRHVPKTTKSKIRLGPQGFGLRHV